MFRLSQHHRRRKFFCRCRLLLQRGGNEDESPTTIGSRSGITYLKTWMEMRMRAAKKVVRVRRGTVAAGNSFFKMCNVAIIGKWRSKIRMSERRKWNSLGTVRKHRKVDGQICFFKQ
ncbi:hypothetical protein L596_010784 [Steinernema carpocapsae]|uniref:Uncharacterized protein n=1 Tax=Steinernema carpocapsae TaxID=34508 RepID=A0A4U5PJM8_STECR|nr:hypothetical protein L596_010784 [Steinernema carpocapsae]